jgi:hypothetical protein
MLQYIFAIEKMGVHRKDRCNLPGAGKKQVLGRSYLTKYTL